MTFLFITCLESRSFDLVALCFLVFIFELETNPTKSLDLLFVEAEYRAHLTRVFPFIFGSKPTETMLKHEHKMNELTSYLRGTNLPRLQPRAFQASRNFNEELKIGKIQLLPAQVL